MNREISMTELGLIFLVCVLIVAQIGAGAGG